MFRVMAGLVPAIHVLSYRHSDSRGCPGRARAWRKQYRYRIDQL